MTLTKHLRGLPLHLRRFHYLLSGAHCPNWRPPHVKCVGLRSACAGVDESAVFIASLALPVRNND